MTMSEGVDVDALWRLADAHLTRYGTAFIRTLVTRAEGATLHTTDGRQILDFTSGQMCAVLGHNHPAITAAVEEAGASVMHLFSGMLSPDVIRFASELAGLLPADLQKVLLVTTGSESNEAAIRMAKMHTGGHEVLGLSGSWHGMTAAASASTYSAGRSGYGPVAPGNMPLPTPNPYRCPVRHCTTTCDMTCLDVGMSLCDAQSVGRPAAVIVEPILSAGGIVPLPDGYLARLRDLAHERGMLLIVDEAQTALGRTGVLFAFEAHGVVPDILTLSKTLGAGLPVAATVTSDEVEDDTADKGFLHFTSHVSDPLAAKVALAVLEVVAQESLVDAAAARGRRLMDGLLDLQQRHECIGDVRGAGLLVGVELVTDRDTREPAEELGTAVTDRCLDLGLNLNIVKFPGMGAVLRIAPPMTVTDDEIDRALEIMDTALSTAGA